MNTNLLLDRYLAEHARFKKSFANDKHLIEKHIRPALGAKPVAGIRYADIHKIHTGLRATPYQANRVLALLSVMFGLAELWEMRPEGSNPCSKVKRYRENRRMRYLTNPELRALINALEARFEKKPLEAGLLLLLLYTGARCGEIGHANWSEIHSTELYLPDSKTGQRIIYLTPQAVKVLARLPRARRWIVGPDVNPRYVWASVLEETGIENLRIHDLRHCFASVGISAQQSLASIGGLLGHASPATTGIYAHLMSSHGQAAALAISKELERITT